MRTFVTILLVLVATFLMVLPNLVLWNPIVREVYAFDLRGLHSMGGADGGKALPAQLKSAFLAADDPEFYTRPAFDPLREGLALLSGHCACSKYAGSPISYHLAQISTQGQPMSQGKWNVVSPAMIFRLEHEFAKDEILDAYLSRIGYGTDIIGVRSAAAYYFDKPPEALTVSETIYLVAGPISGGCRAPARYAIDKVADRLVTSGILRPEEAKAGADEAATLPTARDRPSCNAHH